MIQSDRYNFIFIHCPRTSGDCMTLTLSPYADRIETTGPVKHSRAVELLRDLKEKLANYFRFGFIRNPWEQIHSEYHYCQHRFKFIDNLDETQQHFKNKLIAMSKMTFREYVFDTPASRLKYFFQDIHGNELVDFVGRFGNYSDWYHVLQTIGIPITRLKKGNESNRPRDYRSEYDDEMRELVAEGCKPEIERFGFEF